MTSDVGHVVESSKDDDLYYALGFELERIGTGASLGGPSSRPGTWFGPQHTLLFVQELGEKTDAELRDRLILSEQRVFLLGDQDHTLGINSSGSYGWMMVLWRIGWYVSGLLAALVIVLLFGLLAEADLEGAAGLDRGTSAERCNIPSCLVWLAWSACGC